MLKKRCFFVVVVLWRLSMWQVLLVNGQPFVPSTIRFLRERSPHQQISRWVLGDYVTLEKPYTRYWCEYPKRIKGFYWNFIWTWRKRALVTRQKRRRAQTFVPWHGRARNQSLWHPPASLPASLSSPTAQNTSLFLEMIATKTLWHAVPPSAYSALMKKYEHSVHPFIF